MEYLVIVFSLLLDGLEQIHMEYSISIKQDLSSSDLYFNISASDKLYFSIKQMETGSKRAAAFYIVWMSLSMHPLSSSFLFHTSHNLFLTFVSLIYAIRPQKQYRTFTQMSVSFQYPSPFLGLLCCRPLPVPPPFQTFQSLPDTCSPTHGYRYQWLCCNADGP